MLTAGTQFTHRDGRYRGVVLVGGADTGGRRGVYALIMRGERELRVEVCRDVERFEARLVEGAIAPPQPQPADRQPQPAEQPQAVTPVVRRARGLT
jgi:hypothetical protein